MAKFLIIRFSSIGDIILTSPVVRCIKQQIPNAEVHFVTKKQYGGLLENNPNIDKYFLLDKSLNLLIKNLKSENYDFIIDLHNNLRTSIIKFRLGVKSYSFDKLNWQKWLLVNFKINTMPNKHIVDRYLETVSDFGVKNDNKGLDFFIPKNISNPLSLEPNSYVAFAIGGQHNTKKLPNHKIIELCSKIDKKIVLLGGKEDELNGAEIVKQVGEKVINFCGKCSLNQSAEIVRHADYVISHDTGMMHIAAALKKKTISIWGNTIPEFGMYPYQTEFKVIENKQLGCRPCSKIGYEKCPKGHFKCMQDLDFSRFEIDFKKD
ncbi:MAG: glycosyltransferase family 9 protein [Spirosomaceae bacterium]|jgi:heptosyltransferase-2|nr:glycosyltransferase family 9 protein [Spirosomataceae bacterium]